MVRKEFGMKSMIFFSFLIATSVLVAQQPDKFISMRFADFDYFSEASKKSSFPYYELGFGKLFFKNKFAVSAYYAFWKDDVNKVVFFDGPTFSYSSHIVGIRGAFPIQSLLIHFILPIQIYAGMNYHFLKVHYLGGYDFVGNTFKSSDRKKAMFEYGLLLPIKIYKNFSVVFDYQRNLSF
jgi:hypothetical protein